MHLGSGILLPVPSKQGNRVYLEIGSKRVFACSADWPGWARAGRDDERALAELAAYALRYAPVAEAAGLSFPGSKHAFHVVERVKGSGTTDFGAPGHPAELDLAEVDPEEAGRQAALLAAAWTYLDDVVATAPASLRKGPRGGGRDRDAIAAHVVAAEASYARTIGVRHREPCADDRAAIQALRADIADVLARPWTGEPLTAGKGWPPRYAARRIAWHVLDHAWEIQDKST